MTPPSPSPPSSPGSAPWWPGTVGYEIYVRSFADSTGDGTGDLAGIAAHLDHVAYLGADSIWITPFYPSPGFDHGYDVSDYRGVSPAHGDLDDFDRMRERAHDLGLRVIVDIVPNHTSSQHPWFVGALDGPDAPTRDYYLWRDPAPGGGPPNNWVSHFGGPAWSLDPASGQYYCHLFLPEQPDLNWRNPAVVDEFDEILRYWCERGVDGFRIDVAHGLVKHPDFPDNPQPRPIEDGMGPRELFDCFDHLYDLEQDDNVDVYRRWNRVIAPYGAMLIGEVATSEPHRVARYSSDGDALHSVFYLRPTRTAWDPDELPEILRAMHDACPDGVSWVIDCHDQSRSVSRYGGGDRGRRRSLAVFTLLTALGGTPFLYQGEELGLEDGIVDRTDLEDPISTRNPGTTEGRDGCRTPMPWEPGPGNGFTTAPAAWLPADDRPAEDTVEHQRSDPSSTLHRYRDLLAQRRRLPELWEEPLAWIDTGDQRVLAVRRGSLVVACNFDATARELGLGGDYETDYEIVFVSTPGAMTPDGLDGEAAVVLRRR